MTMHKPTARPAQTGTLTTESPLRDLEAIIRSRTPLIAVESNEEPQIVSLVRQIGGRLQVKAYRWTVTEPLQAFDACDQPAQSVLKSQEALNYIKSSASHSLFVLLDFHPYLQDALHVRYLKDIALTYPKHWSTVVLVGCTVNVPEELRPFTACFRLPLPTLDELRGIVLEAAADLGAEHAGAGEDSSPSDRVDTCPEQMKMDFALWTRVAVGQLIHREVGLSMPIRKVGEYLKRWGFTPQRPLKRAYERNPRKVREWLEQTYPQIARQARQEGAEIHWGDETGMRSDDVNGRGYAPQGRTPVRLTKVTPEKINMISSVTNRGTCRFMFYRGTLTVTVILAFLQRLIRDLQGRKVHLIVDNLRVHHARKVQAWVLRHEKEIALHYLPSYSPELNPDEYGDLKGEISRRADSRRKGRLAQSALSAMRRIQKQPQRVRKYFNAEPVRYAR